MTTNDTTIDRPADILDQLTVRVLIGNAEELRLASLSPILEAHGQLPARGRGASLQRLAAAVITYRHHFALNGGWTIAAGNIAAGTLTWTHGRTTELVIDRLCSRGITSFPGLDTLPATSGSLLRVCDLTYPELSASYESDGRSWSSRPMMAAGAAPVSA